MARVARAAVLGLAAGLALGAAALGVMAARHLQVDCAGLTAQECTFEQEVGTQMGRLQGLAALGLLLVGAGLTVAGSRR